MKKVYYPGLKNHSRRELQEQQARGFSSVLSFETGSFELSKRLVEAAKIFAITVSFGSLNSSISLPGCMSHASIPAELREKRQLPTDLVRLSIGIEDPEDLIEDLNRALEVAAGNTELAAASA